MGELPFVAVLRASYVMFVLAVLLGLSFPPAVGPLPEGMRTPVLALELARSTQEVETMFEAVDSPRRQAHVRAFDRANTFDFAMLLAYGTVLSLFARALRQRTQARVLRVAEAMAVVAPVADALENMRMLEITASLGGDYRSALAALAWFTWAKWGALAIYAACLVPIVITRGTWGRVLGAACLLTVVSTACAYSFRGVWAELMLIAVALCFAGMFLLSRAEQRSNPPRA